MATGSTGDTTGKMDACLCDVMFACSMIANDHVLEPVCRLDWDYIVDFLKPNAKLVWDVWVCGGVLADD